MAEWVATWPTAFWLGVLTSISPCPLAANIAAMSFVGRRVAEPRVVALSGALYTLGRTAAYVALGSLLVAGLLAAPGLSYWLQKYMNRLLGPIFVLASMFLLELVKFDIGRGRLAQRFQPRAERGGLWFALPLGAVMGLTFCPISAALFFGTLAPLAVAQESYVVLPLLYGLGTALPVFAFGVSIGLGAHGVARAFNKLTRFELWARRLTGAVFLVVGVWLTLTYTTGLL